MSQEHINSPEHQTSSGHEAEGGEVAGKSASPPAFQLMASNNNPPAQLQEGDNYERGNRPDPSNSIGGMEIQSSEGRMIRPGDSVTFTLTGRESASGVQWRYINDPRAVASHGLPATSPGPTDELSINATAIAPGVHTIRAEVTDGNTTSYITFRMTVEAEGDYEDISNVTPSPLSTMNDFIDLVERVEAAYAGYAWQDVASKIRKERYPGPGGRYGGIKASFTWDDLIDEQQDLSPLQTSHIPIEDIAALRTTGSVTHNGQTIDIGHVMTGLDSMNFPETNGIFERHNMSGPAAATWSGDVGSSLVNWATDAPLNDASAARKERFYTSYTSVADLLGDIDGINIGGMPNIGASDSLSLRLKKYYRVNVSTQANKRYTNFCQVSGFQQVNGALSSSARAYIREQVLNFARGYNIKGSVLDGFIMGGGGMGGYGGFGGANNYEMTSRARITDNVDWFTNRFIQDIESGLSSE